MPVNRGPRIILSLCVFCGSSSGTAAVHRESAVDLGRRLAAQNCRLVYGGGSVGLMGAIADAVLAEGGKVTGVIPQFLATAELLHPGVKDMRRVPNMHARKAMMSEEADAFIALPGGLGTFEELFEVITWAQLGVHDKPIGLLNSAGYFDPLVHLISHAVDSGFVRSEHRNLIVVRDDSADLLDALATHPMPSVRKWLDHDDT